MKRLAALALCSGCHILFGLEDLHLPPDGSAVDSSTLTHACLLEAFDAPALNNDLWSITDADNTPVVVAQSGGHLTISLAPNLPNQNYNGIETDLLYDLTDTTLQIEIVQAANQVADVETQFFMVDALRANFYMFAIANNELIFYVIENGNISTSPRITYMPSQHRFLRFGHIEATHDVVFSVSADGANFTQAMRVRDTISVKRMFVGAAAGTFGTGAANPGSAVFDDFRANAPAC